MTDAEDAAAGDEPTRADKSAAAPAPKASTADPSTSPKTTAETAGTKRSLAATLAAPFLAIGATVARAGRWLAARVGGDSLRTPATSAASGTAATSTGTPKKQPRSRAAERAPKDGDSVEPLAPRAWRHLRAKPGPRVRWFRRPVTFISAGLVGAAGIALLVAWLLTPPPVEIEPWHQVQARPTPALQPSPAPTLTDFSAALPTATLDYGLTEALAMPWDDRVAWPARNADAWLLRYSAEDGEAIVIAVQHFTEEEAIEAWQALHDISAAAPLGVADDARPDSGDAFLRVDAEPLEEGSAVTELRALLGALEDAAAARAEAAAEAAGDGGPAPSPSASTSPTEPAYVPQGVVVWRNDTAVFALLADADAVVGLYLEYDL